MAHDASATSSDPTSRLSPTQEMRLRHADILAEDGVLRIDPLTTVEQLGGVRMVTNARVLLGALADGPVPATAACGNLPRAFVRRMLDEMSWHPLQQERLGRGERTTFNEEDVPDLSTLRRVLGLAGLLKKRRGSFSLTRRGEQLLEADQAGRLFALLFRTYFGKFNMFYEYAWQDDPEMQARIVFSLWVISEMSGRGGSATESSEPPGATTREIAQVVARDELLWAMMEAQQVAWLADRFPRAVGSVILEPLEDFGLLARTHQDVATSQSYLRSWDLSARWTATALFTTAFTFQLDPVEPDGAALEEAEWAAFVPAAHVTADQAFDRYLTDGASPLVRDAGSHISMLIDAWAAFLDSREAPRRGRRSGGPRGTREAPMTAFDAVATAPEFVEDVRTLEPADVPGPAAFAAAMVADFAVWCAEAGLIPKSMAVRRAQEAEQAAGRFGRALRAGALREGGALDSAAGGTASALRGAGAPENAAADGLAPAAQRPTAATDDTAAAQLRLVPEARATGSTGRVARLTITLLGTEPAVWRRIEVPADSTFSELHSFLNLAMGWEDCHLHEFRFGERLVGGPELNDGAGPEVESEEEVTLADALADGHRMVSYTYDFGDDWHHTVRIDAVEDAEEGVFYPRCIDGARACPPEDVGGAHGYAVFVDAMADPHHPEHADQALWYEEVYGADAFEPEAFDIEAVSRLLRIAATGELAADDLDFFGA